MDDQSKILEWIRYDMSTAIITWPSGSKYMGMVTNKGEREGQGIQTWSNGHIYNGEFKKDQRDGPGRMQGNDGIYTGGWESNSRHGRGSMVWPNGAKYDGEWSSDLRDGQGTMHWTDEENKQYDGTWMDGKRHGAGVMLYGDGVKYSGAFVDNMR